MNSEPQVKVVSAALSDRGLVREHNEDIALARRPFFLVADGMGGHSRGEVAAQEAIGCFAGQPGQEWATAEEVRAAIALAGQRVAALDDHAFRPPGTTLAGVALTIQDGSPCWLVFNIGDSRTYLLRGGRLTQVSVDHSAQRAHPGSGIPRNVITRALGGGIRQPVTADTWVVPIVEGDRILICTDGLYTEVDDQLLGYYLLSNPEPNAAVRALIDAALATGAHDNVTCVVVTASDVRDGIEVARGAASGQYRLDDITVDGSEQDTEEDGSTRELPLYRGEL
ncbi:MAG: protein phosphatase 2C domain-containing protein [Varibaculum sp.]|nr:protein phosphatase 2C domain-containing protein [Varibaculum sp.]